MKKSICILFALLLTLYACAESPESASMLGKTKLSAVWTNEGGDKVRKDELRGSTQGGSVLNSVWDGTKIKLFAAKNEVVSFNLVLESAKQTADNVMVRFNQLKGPQGAVISAPPVAVKDLFQFINRPIELFYVRYLKIEGMSAVSNVSFQDERYFTKTFQLPFTVDANRNAIVTGNLGWNDRTGANKYFPDIAVPLEAVSNFQIPKGENQSIWADIYVPRNAVPGLYTGNVSIVENGGVTQIVPVELRVRRFSLPEVPTAKTMVYIGYQDINQRYLGRSNTKPGTQNEKLSRLIRDRHFLLAHRHKISLVDQDEGNDSWDYDRPRDEWIPRLNGELFSPLNGYDGPGLWVGNGVYSICSYSSCGWKYQNDENIFSQHTDQWQKWFTRNLPDVDRFLFLIDESRDVIQTEMMAKWITTNPGPGSTLRSFATLFDLKSAVNEIPDLKIAGIPFSLGDKNLWEGLATQFTHDPSKAIVFYNGKRPAMGSFATEDDGVALRELVWGQYKKKISRWFYWEGTYYNDFQSGRGDLNVFQTAQTFGSYQSVDDLWNPEKGKYGVGKSGWNYSNGDGLLFYPGTDAVYPDESYGISGPIASLRLKHWRRGIQDADYLSMAEKIDPVKVRNIISTLVPEVLWELGVENPDDPTYVRKGASWSDRPDDWESARAQLADIIESAPSP